MSQPAGIVDAFKNHFGKIGRGYGDREWQLAELAAATRALITEITTTSTDPAAIAAATELVRAATATLAPGPHERAYFGPPSASDGHPTTTFFDYSPFVGPLSPLSPPIEMRLDGDVVVGRVVYDRQFEGPPGCLHGGMIAAGFDEVLGFAQTFSGAPGMTGRLEIRYRSPTPLFEEVTFRGWLESVEGRRVTTSGTLHAGDRLCAEATGLFISFRPNDAPGTKAGPWAASTERGGQTQA